MRLEGKRMRERGSMGNLRREEGEGSVGWGANVGL